ncbi:MAG: SRPBCC domain-containing protein [Longimicrobiales bacterium]
MATVDTGVHSLQIRRTVRATPSRVYRAWTEPAQVARWFAPNRDFQVVVHRLDVRPGGGYRIEMKHPDGSSHVAIGEYKELEENLRLTFSWRWEGAPMEDTLVTVEFTRLGDDTEVVLTHSRFTSESQRDEHSKGWTGCLTQLVDAFTAER